MLMSLLKMRENDVKWMTKNEKKKKKLHEMWQVKLSQAYYHHQHQYSQSFDR